MKTAKVRIAVAIGENSWSCSGGEGMTERYTDEYLLIRAQAKVKGNVLHTCFIEAEIPIPETETIRGLIK